MEFIQEGVSGNQSLCIFTFQPKQNFESPICVSWNTDGKGGRWTPSGCVTLEASETHTVCSCNQMVNLAVIMASGELTVSTDALYSGSPNPMGKD